MPSITFLDVRGFLHVDIHFFDKTRAFHPMSVHTILNGNRNLSDDDNILFFDAVQQYIYETRRFNQ